MYFMKLFSLFFTSLLLAACASNRAYFVDTMDVPPGQRGYDVNQNGRISKREAKMFGYDIMSHSQLQYYSTDPEYYKKRDETEYNSIVQLVDDEKALKKVKKSLSNPAAFIGYYKSKYNDVGTAIYAYIDLDSISRITRSEAKWLKSTSPDIINNKLYEIFSFKADFTDLWTGEKSPGYFRIEKHTQDTSLFVPNDNVRKYKKLYLNRDYVIINEKTQSPMVPMAYMVLKKFNDSILEFTLTFLNKSPKKIIRYTAKVALINEHDELIKYFDINHSAEINPAAFYLGKDHSFYKFKIKYPDYNKGIKKLIPRITEIYYEDGTSEKINEKTN
jgi:hypothetical protein